MSGRISQVIGEPLHTGTPAARDSQVVVEASLVGTPAARGSQVVVEALYRPGPRVGQVAVEVLYGLVAPFVNGTDVLVYVYDGMVWQPVGMQLGLQLVEETAAADISGKAERERRTTAGRYASALLLDALYVPGEAAFGALRAAQRSGAAVRVMRRQNGRYVAEEALAVVAGMSEELPNGEAAEIAVALVLDGGWTPVKVGLA